MTDKEDPSHWMRTLGLEAHPEGGFFRETYRSDRVLPEAALSPAFTGNRNASTAIYFLLRSHDRSAFHKILSDELWHFHTGSTLLIYTLHEHRGLHIHRLGLDIASGDRPQVMIPAGTWFGASVEADNSYTLSSCTVAPGFDFKDFEMADGSLLLKQFPSFKDIIIKLT
jgi:predicted cupin superfamily sugar epimerase